MEKAKIVDSVIAGGNVRNSNNGNITSNVGDPKKDTTDLSVKRTIIARKNVNKSNNDNSDSEGNNIVIIKKIRKETVIISLIVSFIIGFGASFLATYLYDRHFESKRFTTNDEGGYAVVSQIEHTSSSPILK